MYNVRLSYFFYCPEKNGEICLPSLVPINVRTRPTVPDFFYWRYCKILYLQFVTIPSLLLLNSVLMLMIGFLQRFLLYIFSHVFRIGARGVSDHTSIISRKIAIP